jgi:hypothetical protein
MITTEDEYASRESHSAICPYCRIPRNHALFSLPGRGNGFWPVESYRGIGSCCLRRGTGSSFPYRLVNYAGNMKISIISLSELKVNSDIPKEMFAPGMGKDK